MELREISHQALRRGKPRGVFEEGVAADTAQPELRISTSISIRIKKYKYMYRYEYQPELCFNTSTSMSIKSAPARGGCRGG